MRDMKYLNILNNMACLVLLGLIFTIDKMSGRGGF